MRMRKSTYGFRRNLWGCRTVGRWIAAAGLMLALFAVALKVYGVLEVSSIGLVLAIGIDVTMFGILEFVATPNWVRTAGEAYARQLLAALEVLATPAETPAQRDAEIARTSRRSPDRVACAVTWSGMA